MEQLDRISRLALEIGVHLGDLRYIFEMLITVWPAMAPILRHRKVNYCRRQTLRNTAFWPPSLNRFPRQFISVAIPRCVISEEQNLDQGGLPLEIVSSSIVI